MPTPVTRFEPPRWSSAPALDDVRSGSALLRQRQSGPEVRELQRRLSAAGYPVTVDGKLGPETERAVRRFQQAAGLEVDGLVGPLTMRALDSRFEPPRTAPAVPGVTGPVSPPAQQGRLPGEDLATAMHGPDFVPRVREIAARHGLRPEWLMTVMQSESRFRTDLPNPTSGAMGLLQFMPDTARGLGTSTQALSRMTGVQQLEYVDRYLAGLPRGQIRSGADLYLANFYPAALGRPDEFVIGLERGEARARQVGAQNRPFDLNGDGRITVGEFRDFYRRRFPGL